MKIVTSERLVKVETELKYIKNTVEETHSDLKSFISCADKKYATKDELNNVKLKIMNDQNDSSNWKRTFIGPIIMIIIAIFQFILFLKTSGAIK